jgi:transposase
MYSTDLKRRVIDFVARGGRKTEAVDLFKVGRSTIFAWLKHTPNHVPGKPGPKEARKVDRDILFQTIQDEPNLLIAELADRFGVSPSTMHYNMQFLGLTGSKRRSTLKKRGASHKMAANQGAATEKTRANNRAMPSQVAS